MLGNSNGVPILCQLTSPVDTLVVRCNWFPWTVGVGVYFNSLMYTYNLIFYRN